MENLRAYDFIAEWDDKDRIAFLYSAFPSNRDLNTHHFDSKLAYWKKIILSITSSDSYKSCWFRWNDLCHLLKKDNRQPLGLDIVFDEMLKGGELKSVDAYLQDLQAKETWVGWGMNYVKKPSQWVFNKVLSPLKKRNGNQEFVLLQAVENKANKLLKLIQSIQSNGGNSVEHHYANMGIFAYSELADASTHLIGDLKSLDIVLAHLKSLGKVVVYAKEENEEKAIALDQKYVKFARENESRVQPINEANVGFIELYKSRCKLEKSVHKMYEEIESLKINAKSLIKENKKGLALNSLRKKQRISNVIVQKESALQNLDKLLESIGQAKTDKMIMDAYKTGVKAYHDLIKTEGMSLDEIEKTKSEVSDVFDLQNDISESISSSFQSEFDDATLESELNSILAEDDLEEALKNLSLSDNQVNGLAKSDDVLLLPEAPNNNLTTNQSDEKMKACNLKQNEPLPAS